jgi:hypothetical protein
LNSLSFSPLFSLRGVGVLCCIAVGAMPLLHCAWLVVRVGVLCYIVVGGDPRTPLLRCARPHRCAWVSCARKRAVCIVVGETPKPPFSAVLGLAAALVVGGDPRTPLIRCARPHRCAWLSCARKRAVCVVVGKTPKPSFSAVLGLATALCNLLRVGVLWCVCMLVFQ